MKGCVMRGIGVTLRIAADPTNFQSVLETIDSAIARNKGNWAHATDRTSECRVSLGTLKGTVQSY